MSIIELEDVAFGLVLALMTIGIATLFRLWIKGDTRRNGRRRGRGPGRGARQGNEAGDEFDRLQPRDEVRAGDARQRRQPPGLDRGYVESALNPSAVRPDDFATVTLERGGKSAEAATVQIVRPAGTKS